MIQYFKIPLIKIFFGLFFYSQMSTANPIPVEEWDKPKVGVYYFGNFAHSANPNQPIENLFWWRGVKQFFEKSGSAYEFWKQKTPDMRTDHLKPLIGYYNHDNSNVVAEHIHQAYLGGIDYFNFYWYWSASRKTANHTQALNAFQIANNNWKMNFTVSIFAHPWDEDLKISISDIPKIVSQMFALFGHPRYLRIGDRPIVTIGDGRGIGAGTVADMQALISALKNFSTTNGFPQPVVLIGPGSTAQWDQVNNRDGFQCLVIDSGISASSFPYDSMIKAIPGYLASVSANGPLSPCLASDFNERPRQDVMVPDPNSIRFFTGQTPEKFAQAMSLIREWQKTQIGEIPKLVNLYAWNEWHEGGIIEPNMADRYLYLEKIQYAFKTIPLRRYNLGQHRVTTKKLSSGMVEATWLIFTENKEGQKRIPIYECRLSANHFFVSLDVKCEGQTVVGLLGYVASASQSYPEGNLDLVPLFRCNSGSSHFVSSDPACEGTMKEGLLGYGFYGGR